MAINFPDNPTVGQTFTSANRTWTYNGSSWVGDYSSTGNADFLDGIDSTQFLRSDADTTLLNGNLTLNKNLSDTILNLETDVSGAYDPIINMGSGQNDISFEGFQIWYSNNVGDVHLSTTYNNAASAIRFHTATGTNKVGTGVNERLTITGSGNVGVGKTNPAELLDVGGDVQISSTLNLRSASNLSSIGFNRRVINGAIFNSSNNAYQLQRNGNDFELQHYNGSGGFLGHPFYVQGSTGNVGIGTNGPYTKFSVLGPHYSPADTNRVLNWYDTTTELHNDKIGLTYVNNNNSTVQPQNIGLALANFSSTNNTWSPAITFGGLSTSGQYMNGAAAIAVQMPSNTSDTNFRSGNIHFFTKGLTITERGLTTRFIVKNDGDVDITNGKIQIGTSASTNDASGFTVYNSNRTGYLSYRITTDAHTRGFGWELTDDEADASAAAATPYFRVDYNYKTIQIIAQTESQLSASAPAGSIAYVTDNDGQLFYKNSVGWSSFTSVPIGSVASSPAPSATAILTAGASTGDGYYYIKPHNTSPTYYVYCDMTTDGGGWILMINARPNNGGQYTDNNDFGLSTISGVTGVPEYNKSTTSMFGTTKIADFFKMTGFKYGRMTPGPGVSITAPYTGLYQRIGTSTTNFWEGSGNDCSLRSTLASRNAWVLTQYKNWSDAQTASNGRVGTYTGANHDYPTTYDNAWQNFWKGDQDGLRFSSTFDGENYGSIGQNTSPGYWWIKSDQ